MDSSGSSSLAHKHERRKSSALATASADVLCERVRMYGPLQSALTTTRYRVLVIVVHRKGDIR